MYNFKEIEKQAGKLTRKQDIKKAVSDDKTRKKTFSFLEGPPTANAPPGLHHLEVRTYKDIINKFRYMQGYNVPRKAGWDCHGLPVEVQIEKELKLNSKKEIAEFGIEKFIKKCRESVFSYISEWNKSTEKLGYWIDLDNPYVTLSNEYIESVWWSLKELYNKKLLYEDHKVVPFCPRCETPLSSHEVALGYKKIKEDSIIVKFKLKGKSEFLLVWTTTPWTLPSNLAIAVNPDLDYAYVKDKETYIVAKELAKNFFEKPNIIKKVKGRELAGMKYEPLFPYFSGKDAFRVIKGNFVTTEEGTGLVHMAPAFGETDYDACKAEGLPFVQPVDENGKFTKEIPDLAGKFIKSADKEIMKKLEAGKKLFKILSYEHDYPFCWRCNTPLMYYAIKSWFIAVTKYKQRLIELNKEINWVPKHLKEGRFGDWLENVKDWALSRKKFWGTPLPVWKCSCGKERIIGSIEELKEKSARKITDNIDLHKPGIDSIKIKCSCGKEMSRVEEVIDCWYDSGSATFAQFHYPFENKDYFKKRFPYDFVSEAIDQTRGWFYTLHVLSTILFDNIAYRNVICAGHIVDEKGEKMSKSKGNILNPDKVLDEIGVDAVRLQFCTVDIGDSKRFGVQMAREEVIPFLNILWNTYQYYKQLQQDGSAKKETEDIWIISRLNSTIKEATENLENYAIEKALKPIIDFITNDFSRGYIRMARERKDSNPKKVISEILEKVSCILAPYAPNISEVIHQEFSDKSVHLSSWPEYSKNKIDSGLEKSMNGVFGIIELGLAERNNVKIGLKWPLAEAVIHANKEVYDTLSNNKELLEIIKQQLNVKFVKSIKSAEADSTKIRLDTKITPELEAEGYVREICRRIQEARKDAGLEKEQKIGLILQSNEKLRKILKENEKIIKEKINASALAFTGIESGAKNYKFSAEDRIRDEKIRILFNITEKQ